MDGKITVQELKQQVSRFRDERDWLKYDSPKNLAISISVEAAELLEHFQWKTDEQVSEALRDEMKLNKITSELADIIIYCLGFSDVLHIDVSEAVERKLNQNSEKYPVANPQLAS
jgi:NTP pyrophosphatase (non-canonical NTP hydrolase)